MNWKGEIAAILVRLEHGRIEDAKHMCKVLMGDTKYHTDAQQEYIDEFGEG